MSFARALGDVADPESSSSSSGEYAAWTSFVQSNGGRVAPYPFTNLGHVTVIGRIVGVKWILAQGLPSGAFPFDVIYPNYGTALNPIFDRQPDAWSDDSSTGYFLAPKGALSDFLDHAADPGDTLGIGSILKYAAFAGGALLALNLMSFLPRRRD